MPTNFGATPTSTTGLGVNQFPVSAVFVPGTSGGGLIALQGGPATTDGNGYTSAPFALYVPDGNDVTLGATTDLSSANTLIGIAKAIKANTASVTIGSGTVTANAGTNLNTSALALDTSVNGVLVAQGSTTSGSKGPLVQGAVTTSAPSYTTAQTSPISLTTAGAVRVDASATTQPMSATSLPLPAGASTAAKQPALGTAGAASSDVLTVQGIASMTALKVDGSAVTQPVSGSVTVTQATAANLNATATIQAVTGTSLAADQSNSELRTSLYGKNSSAGDTAVHVNASGDQYMLGNFTEQAALSAGSLNADLVASIDVSAYRWLSLHITGTYSGTLTFQGSNDNVNFVSVPLLLSTSYNVNNLATSTTSTGVLFTGPLFFRYFRCRMTAYTSGTANGTLELYTQSPSTIGVATVGAAQSGTWTVQPGNTANTTPWLSTINQGGNSASVNASNALKVDNSAVTQPTNITQVLSATLSNTNPVLTEPNIQNWIRNGQGFIATSGNLATATNTNVLVCAISLFNPAASGKNVLIYSIQVTQNGSETGHEQWRATTTDPSGTTGFTNTLSATNLNLGSATTSVASLCSSPTGITTSVTATGTAMGTFAVNSNNVVELLTNGATILLPNGSAHGIEVLSQVNTAGNTFVGQMKWIEY